MNENIVVGTDLMLQGTVVENEPLPGDVESEPLPGDVPWPIYGAAC